MKEISTWICVAVSVCWLTDNLNADDKKDAPERDWQALFDGKSLQGWHHESDGEWVVEDGAITGKTQTAAKLYGLLVSDKKYKNLRVKFTFQSLEGNSGFFTAGEVQGYPDRGIGRKDETIDL